MTVFLRLVAGIAVLFAAENSATAAERFPLGCRFGWNMDPVYGGCAGKMPDGVRVSPRRLARMPFEHGLAQAWIETLGWSWIRPDGLAIGVLTFDNGPDPFNEGLTRSSIDGKVAYYDRHLRRVLATPYDWASEFEHGRAVVCVGCVREKTEMGFMVGGLWGQIDRKGRVIVPVDLTQEALAARLAR